MSGRRMICSIDTCFIIDWARYSRRGLLYRLFDLCYITEDVVREIKSEVTAEFVAEGLARGFLAFYPFMDALEPIVRDVMSVRDPRIRRLDPPEAYAIAIGYREGAVVLTENKGAVALTRYVPKYSSVKVWRSIDVLRELAARGLINLGEELDRYERETGHRFPRREGGTAGRG